MKRLLIFLLLIIFIGYVKIDKITLVDYQNETINVEVKGLDAQNGNYTFTMYSTYNDLFSKLNIPKDIDLTVFNLNNILENNSVINFQKIKEEVKISINFGTLEELDSLDGIGEKTALRIIEYRKNNGLFKSLEDIMLVSGIKESKYLKIKDYICL